MWHYTVIIINFTFHESNNGIFFRLNKSFARLDWAGLGIGCGPIKAAYVWLGLYTYIYDIYTILLELLQQAEANRLCKLPVKYDLYIIHMCLSLSLVLSLALCVFPALNSIMQCKYPRTNTHREIQIEKQGEQRHRQRQRQRQFGPQLATRQENSLGKHTHTVWAIYERGSRAGGVAGAGGRVQAGLLACLGRLSKNICNAKQTLCTTTTTDDAGAKKLK